MSFKRQLAQCSSLSANKDHGKLAISMPFAKHWECHQCFVSNTPFLRLVLKHSHTLLSPLPSAHHHHHHHHYLQTLQSLSLVSPQLLLRQGSTRVKHRDCSTRLAHCNYSCCYHLHFIALRLARWTESVATQLCYPPSALNKLLQNLLEVGASSGNMELAVYSAFIGAPFYFLVVVVFLDYRDVQGCLLRDL